MCSRISSIPKIKLVQFCYLTLFLSLCRQTNFNKKPHFPQYFFLNRFPASQHGNSQKRDFQHSELNFLLIGCNFAAFLFFGHAHRPKFGLFLRIYFEFFCRSLLFPFAFLFIGSFVAHFIVFLLHEILAGFLSNKGRNLIVKRSW